MSNQIREALTKITEKNLRIKEIHQYFIDNAINTYNYKLIETESVIFGHTISTLILTIDNCHGLVFRLSSDYFDYYIFENYIVGNYTKILNKWSYSPIHIDYNKSNVEILSLFMKFSNKKYLKLLCDKEYSINILHSDYIKHYVN